MEVWECDERRTADYHTLGFQLAKDAPRAKCYSPKQNASWTDTAPPVVWKLLFAFGRDGADQACLANGTRSIRMPSAEADNTGCCNDSGTVRGIPGALGHCCAKGANTMNTRLNGGERR
jgi:hypothetical protein